MPTPVLSELLNAASTEMQRDGDNILHPEYLLIAVADAAPLRRRGVTSDVLRSQVRRIMGPVNRSDSRVGINDTTSRVLAIAKQHAASRSSQQATADDVLFALLDETEGPQIGPVVLEAMGVDVQTIRDELTVAKLET